MNTAVDSIDTWRAKFEQYLAPEHLAEFREFWLKLRQHHGDNDELLALVTYLTFLATFLAKTPGQIGEQRAQFELLFKHSIQSFSTETEKLTNAATSVGDRGQQVVDTIREAEEALKQMLLAKYHLIETKADDLIRSISPPQTAAAIQETAHAMASRVVALVATGLQTHSREARAAAETLAYERQQFVLAAQDVRNIVTASTASVAKETQDKLRSYAVRLSLLSVVTSAVGMFVGAAIFKWIA